MPTNIVGPHGAGVNPTTTRPTDASSGLSSDTWFAPCVGNDPNTGTKIPAIWLNKMTALMRRAIRGMSVTESEVDDDMLLKAIQKADRGFDNVGTGSGAIGIFKEINGTDGRIKLYKIRGINGLSVTVNTETGDIVLDPGTAGGGGTPTLPTISAIRKGTWDATSFDAHTIDVPDWSALTALSGGEVTALTDTITSTGSGSCLTIAENDACVIAVRFASATKDLKRITLHPSNDAGFSAAWYWGSLPVQNQGNSHVWSVYGQNGTGPKFRIDSLRQHNGGALAPFSWQLSTGGAAFDTFYVCFDAVASHPSNVFVSELTLSVS